MNQHQARTMVNCLTANGPAANHLARLRTWARRDWQGALRWLHTGGLALYFRHRLKELGAEGVLPSEVRVRLLRNHTTHCRRVAAMRNEFDQLNRCFAEAGIRFAALKGFSMIPDYCPDATLRTQYDFDYLVAPESKAQAEEALRAASYVGSSGDDAGRLVFFRSNRPPRIPAHDDELYSPDLPLRVEVHTRLWEPGPEAIRVPGLDDALGRVQIREWQGLSFPALADEDALAFQVVHALRHIFENWCRLSILLEIATFLERRSKDEGFWERFRHRAGSCPGFPKAAAVVFSLSAGLFRAQFAPSLREWVELNLSASLARWVVTYGLDGALENFMGEKFSLFLQREFVADASTWRSVRKRKLFPLHIPNRAAQATSPGWGPGLSAACKQAMHVVRRLRFHLISVLRYAWELPRWERRRSRTSAGAIVKNGHRPQVTRDPLPVSPADH